MERCAFFFDFDNTLYSHATKTITENTKKALAELIRRGHKVIIASGRGMEALELFKKELGFLPETLILMNGQIVLMGEEIVYENHISLKELDGLFDTARRHGIAYGGYCREGVVVSEINERVEAVWRDFSAPLPMVNKNCEKEQHIYQAHLYITEGERELFGREIETYIPNWSHEYLVNLIHRSTGKAKGIRSCLEKWGISEKNVYAFGDGYNDMDMIEAAGHGVAVRGGFEPLERAAEYITGRPEEEGICQALRHYGFWEGNF